MVEGIIDSAPERRHNNSLCFECVITGAKVECRYRLHCLRSKAFVKVKYVYHSEGETAVLKCLPDAFKVDWIGPSHTNLLTSSAVERDIYGKKRNWTISTYFNQNSFDPKLPHLNRLTIVGNRDAGHYDLKIRSVSSFDEGFYKCDVLGMNGTVENLRYILQIKAPPSEMEFVNSTNDGKITGIEQNLLSVVCRVKMGKPPEKLTLKRDGTVINTTMHGIIEYEFTADRMDNHQQFVCEANSMLTSAPVSKTVQIEIKYKPILTIKHEVNKVNEGRTISLCSYIDSNPTPIKIWWSRGYNRIDSYMYNITSSCYVISNITRNDKGDYKCTAKNEIGEGSTMLTVVVRYSSSTGILILTRSESKLNRYQDSGIYICRVSNGIPDGNNNYEQEGKGVFVSEGPPVIVQENSPTQYDIRGQHTIIKLNVLSYSDISCTDIRIVYNQIGPIDNLRITIGPAKIKDVFHGKNVSVDGFKVAFHFTKSKKYHFQLYNITVCDKFGSQSYMVELHSFQEGKALSSQGIVILVLLIIIVILMAGIGIYVRHLKKKSRKRMISAIRDGTPERTDIETAHYIEINEDIIAQTTSRDNNATDEGTRVRDRDITRESMEHISVSSENDSNTAEYLDDGYEKPYTTLVETNRVHDEYVYLITKMKSGNEKSINFDTAGCKQALTCTEQNPSLEKTNTNENVNYDQNDIKLKTVENYLYEVECDIKAKVYPDKNKAQYINLSLKH
ncbi:unnamed protein product [Mytilus coruscus]|uniref:Ig-like domain-containing protein n=1 Tax=Mytilus coruscus TaxID=42192 RepID=A0A6J8C904_MYTCO|nr:unnamed protein product [Mytilus coruscus]